MDLPTEMTAIQPLYAELKPRPKASKDAPIGIFDSGVGGLTIAQEIVQHLPNEQIVYYADTAHVPYGSRSDYEIQQLTGQAIEWLYRHGCKMAVVACNTASAFSLDYLREHYGEAFPIVGLVPALKPAVLHSQSKVVAVLATPATFRGQLIKDVIQNFARPAGVKVLPVTSLALVPLIEAGQQMSRECLNVLKQCLQPIVDQHADFLVLGCTHYPFLTEAITSLFGQKLKLIDSGLAVARQTGRILIKHELLFDGVRQNHLQIDCFVSGNNADELKCVLGHMISDQIVWQIHNIAKSMCITQ